MLPQARPLRAPAADADVDVVALREDPAVAAGDDTELERQTAAEAILALRATFPSSADPALDLAREAKSPAP